MNGDHKDMFNVTDSSVEETGTTNGAETLDLMEVSAQKADTENKPIDKKELWQNVGIVGAVVGILALLSTAIFMIVSANSPSVEPSEPISDIVAVSSEKESKPDVSNKEVVSRVAEVSSKTVSEKPYIPKKPTYPSVAKKQHSPFAKVRRSRLWGCTICVFSL